MKEVALTPAVQAFLSSCTPSYLNNEGSELGPHPYYGTEYMNGGAVGFLRYIQHWRDSGEFDGLEFTFGNTRRDEAPHSGVRP